jgi:hypothetical protein
VVIGRSDAHPFRYLLWLLAAWSALYVPLLVGGRFLPARDVAVMQLPWRAVWRAQVRELTLPVWDPCSNGGRLMLANPNTMAAYPGTLLFAVFEPETASLIHVALHHLLFALGCWRLARRAGASPAAAALASAWASTCGIAWSALNLLNLQTALAWMPWLLAGAVDTRATRTTALKQGLWAGAIAGLAFLGGEPVTAMLGLGCWLVLIAISPTRPRSAAVAGGVIGTIGIAAPVLVPMVLAWNGTVRGVLGVPPGAVAADALAPRRWLELLLPSVLGPPFADASNGFWAAASFPWLRLFPMIFVGLVPLVFAARAPRQRPFGTLLVLAGSGLAAAGLLGLPSLDAITRSVPVLGALRYGIKLLTVPLVALVPLVAVGWDAARERWAAVGRTLSLGGLAVALALVGVFSLPGLGARPLLGRTYPASKTLLASVSDGELRRAGVRDSVALALPALALLLAGPVPSVAIASTLAAGYLCGQPIVMSARTKTWSSPPRLVRALPPDARIAVFAKQGTPKEEAEPPGLGLFWRARAGLVPESGTRFGIGYVLARGADGLEPAHEELVAGAVEKMSLAERARVAAALGADAVIDLAPVPGWHAEEIDGLWLSTPRVPSPEVYLASRVLIAEGVLRTVGTLAATGFRPGQDVVAADPGWWNRGAAGTVTEEHGSPHARRFAVDAQGPTVLVVQQSFMRCWQARVDGERVPVGLVNGASIGVPLPGGRHTVQLFIPRQPYFIGMLGPLVVLGLAVGLRLRQPPRAPSAEYRDPLYLETRHEDSVK